ncbi:MAG: AgmX/PglI C-terminal domain-containing protein [Myxococcota bacterium]
MIDATPQNEQELRAQLGRARERLDGLVRDLRTLDAELEDLSSERQPYELLEQVCGALEKLGELDASGLFWGEQMREGEGDAHVRGVQRRVDDFQGRLREVGARRQAVLEKIEHEHENTELLEDDIYQVQQEEERRKQAWIIEREVDAFPAHESVMPWARGGEDDRRYRKSLAASLLLSLLLSLLFPLIDLPVLEREEVIEVPDRLARLIRKQRPLPPPPVREETRPPEEPVEPELKEPEPSEESPLLAEEGTPKPAPQQAKPRAASKGILAFREKFSGLAASDPDARLGARARISSAGETASGRPERSMVVTQAPGSSGGINLAALSRGVGGGGGQIEGVQVARATSSIAGAGGSDRPLSGGPGSARTDEEIQIVFDRHKAALYRLYNRELRRDPTLKGQMVLRIRIEPDGSVSLCELRSTDMKAPQLSAQVVARVGTFDFGAKEGIPAITILYPIDFLPAT